MTLCFRQLTIAFLRTGSTKTLPSLRPTAQLIPISVLHMCIMLAHHENKISFLVFHFNDMIHTCLEPED